MFIDLIVWLIFGIVVVAILLLITSTSGCYWPYAQEHRRETLTYRPDANEIVFEYKTLITVGSVNFMTNKESDAIDANTPQITVRSGKYHYIAGDPNSIKAAGTAMGEFAGEAAKKAVAR
jgi:hypothetical protein